ncbi:MAG: hypothetical protein IK002_10355 [Treponema sp.]|uniref:hypothetical protein n=1 Tax=Treponema sp. TaxID=166 RepID=UPI00298EA370|nr:hypothetical protein [Treponema sp.]MBR5934376.1 hypothetical protein [Treponema sp.]
MDLKDNLLGICIITIFTTMKLLLSYYFCLKKKFLFSTITFFSFILNFGISSFICIFVKHDIIAVMVILSVGVISFIYSASNIMFTFFFKLFRKRFCSFRYALLFFLLVEFFNIIGIPALMSMSSNKESWINGRFFIYYTCGFVVLFLSLLIWHFFEMKNKKVKVMKFQGDDTENSSSHQ